MWLVQATDKQPAVETLALCKWQARKIDVTCVFWFCFFLFSASAPEQQPQPRPYQGVRVKEPVKELLKRKRGNVHNASATAPTTVGQKTEMENSPWVAPWLSSPVTSWQYFGNERNLCISKALWRQCLCYLQTPLNISSDGVSLGCWVPPVAIDLMEGLKCFALDRS